MEKYTKQMIKLLKDFFYKKKYTSILKEINGYRKIDGWLTDREAYGLYNISSKLGKGAVVVEIGSWKGKSTYCIAKGLKKGTIYAIDPFNAEGEEGSKDIYQQNKGEMPLLDQFTGKMGELGVMGSIKALKGYSHEFVDTISTMDFLFIDGDHSIEGCRYDFEQYSPLLKTGGFVAFHDYYPERDELGPTWVIKNLVRTNKDFHFFRQYDSLWVAKKLK